MARTYTIEPPPVAQPTGGVSGGGGVDNSGWQMLYQALGDLAAQGEQRRARKEEFKFREKEQAKQHAHEKETTGTYAERTEKAEELATPVGRANLAEKQLRKKYSEGSNALPNAGSMLFKELLGAWYKDVAEPMIEADMQVMDKKIMHLTGIQDKLKARQFQVDLHDELISSAADVSRRMTDLKSKNSIDAFGSRWLAELKREQDQEFAAHAAILRSGEEGMTQGAWGLREASSSVLADPQFQSAFRTPERRFAPPPGTTGKAATWEGPGRPVGYAEWMAIQNASQGGLFQTWGGPGNGFNQDQVDKLVESLPRLDSAYTERMREFMGRGIRAKYLGQPMEETTIGPGGQNIPLLTDTEAYLLSAQLTGGILQANDILTNGAETAGAAQMAKPTGVGTPEEQAKAQETYRAATRQMLTPEKADALRAVRQVYLDIVADLRPYRNRVFLAHARAVRNREAFTEAVAKGGSVPEVTDLCLKTMATDALTKALVADKMWNTAAGDADKRTPLLEELAAIDPEMFGEAYKQSNGDVQKGIQVLRGQMAQVQERLEILPPALSARAQGDLNKMDLLAACQKAGLKNVPYYLQGTFRYVEQTKAKFPSWALGEPSGGPEVLGTLPSQASTTQPTTQPATGGAVPPELPAPAPDMSSMGLTPFSAGLQTAADQAGASAEKHQQRAALLGSTDPATTVLDSILADPETLRSLTSGTGLTEWANQELSLPGQVSRMRKKGDAGFRQTREATGMGAGGNPMDVLPPGLQAAAVGQAPDQVGTQPGAQPAGAGQTAPAQQPADPRRAQQVPRRPAQPAPVPQPGPFPQPRPVSAAAPFI